MSEEQRPQDHQLRGKFITQYLQLEEPPAHRYTVRLIMTVVGLMITGLIWAALTPVAELAYARGEVVPVGLTHRIQHPEGGRVSVINVTNGAFVERGDALLSLSSEEVNAQLRQVRARYSALRLESERLAALLAEGPMSLSAAPQYANLVAKQENSYLRELANLADRRLALEHDVAQRASELSRFEQEAEVLLSRVEVLQEKMDMLSSLAASETVAPLDLMETRAQLAQVEAEYIRAQGGAESARSARASALARLAQIGSEWKRELSARANEVAAQMAEVEESVAALQHRASTLHIAAPIDGIVKLTNFAAVNAVVGAGEVIMEIVPTSDTMLVQALVATADIGFVDVGQATRVEFDGYDRNIHGTLEGRVKRISASTYLDPEGTPYYQAEVMLTDDERNRTHMALLPGMTAQVEIVTGEKSVLAYLGRPVLRGMQDALHER